MKENIPKASASVPANTEGATPGPVEPQPPGPPAGPLSYPPPKLKIRNTARTSLQAGTRSR